MRTMQENERKTLYLGSACVAMSDSMSSEAAPLLLIMGINYPVWNSGFRESCGG